MTTTNGRFLNDLALSAGRKRQSKQTGFIHYYYSESEDELQQAMPIYENALFILALLKSKTIEQMAEAKELLDRLLWFQNPTDGNFPVYIHEYPRCHDRFIGSHLLPVFYYILQEFHSILGADLKQRLTQSVQRLVQFIFATLNEKDSSYSLMVKFAASAKVLGTLLKDSEMEKQGSDLFEQCRHLGIQPSWYIPSSAADICTALQMVYLSIFETPWKDFGSHLANTWHVPTKSYIGPGLKEYQYGDEPQATLYDLYMGYLSGGFSQRALNDAAYHLQAALIRPIDQFISPFNYPFKVRGVIENSPWEIYQEKGFAYSLLDIGALSNQAQAHAFHPFKLHWGDENKVHTFVFQAGNINQFSFSAKAKQIEFNFQLADSQALEDREKCRELAFFYDVEPDVKMTIHGETATTFQMQEEFMLETPQLKLILTAELVEGEGQFIGHLMRGNRPSQLKLKGSHRFNAYDWQLFFRTLRRTSPCRIKAILRIEQHA